jgi:hypothetical protein
VSTHSSLTSSSSIKLCIDTMKFRSVSLLAFAAVDVQAFFVPSRSKSFAIQKDVAASRSLLVRSSMTAVSENKTWRDVQDFNMGLDKLAERAGSPNEHVISRAAECQELWETQLSEATDALRPDTISFNTVLKAWNKCCQSLTDRDRHVVAPPADLGRSVPIYTPRDAAERATTLLFQQESNINAARPDSTSYNIVIGQFNSQGFFQQLLSSSFAHLVFSLSS